jgi:hypothetical protein
MPGAKLLPPAGLSRLKGEPFPEGDRTTNGSLPGISVSVLIFPMIDKNLTVF